MLKKKDKRRHLGVSVIVESQLSSHTDCEAFLVERLSLQRGLKPLPTQTTCKCTMPQKGPFVIQSQGLLRKGNSKCLCPTHSLGLQLPSSSPTPWRRLCQHCCQEFTTTIACLRVAQDNLQAKASRTLGHPGQFRPLLPARKVFNAPCTHLQVLLAHSRFELQWDGGYVLGPGDPALQHVLRHHRGQDSALGQLQKPRHSGA